jgi:uncharacterized protein (DUF2225 family)
MNLKDTIKHTDIYPIFLSIYVVCPLCEIEKRLLQNQLKIDVHAQNRLVR